MNKLKFLVVIMTGATVLGTAVYGALSEVQDGRAKRKEIDHDRDLDLQAIERARLEVVKRLNAAPVLWSVPRLIEETRTEIEFQKIAIREE